jgi:hypothetical protein
MRPQVPLQGKQRCTDRHEPQRRSLGENGYRVDERGRELERVACAGRVSARPPGSTHPAEPLSKPNLALLVYPARAPATSPATLPIACRVRPARRWTCWVRIAAAVELLGPVHVDEHLGQRRRDRNPPRALALRSVDDRVPEGTTDGDPTCRQVDIGPAQRTHLASTEPALGCRRRFTSSASWTRSASSAATTRGETEPLGGSERISVSKRVWGLSPGKVESAGRAGALR